MSCDNFRDPQSKHLCPYLTDLNGFPFHIWQSLKCIYGSNDVSWCLILGDTIRLKILPEMYFSMCILGECQSLDDKIRNYLNVEN